MATTTTGLQGPSTASGKPGNWLWIFIAMLGEKAESPLHHLHPGFLFFFKKNQILLSFLFLDGVVLLDPETVSGRKGTFLVSFLFLPSSKTLFIYLAN